MVCVLIIWIDFYYFYFPGLVISSSFDLVNVFSQNVMAILIWEQNNHPFQLILFQFDWYKENVLEFLVLYLSKEQTVWAKEPEWLSLFSGNLLMSKDKVDLFAFPLQFSSLGPLHFCATNICNPLYWEKGLWKMKFIILLIYILLKLILSGNTNYPSCCIKGDKCYYFLVVR